MSRKAQYKEALKSCFPSAFVNVDDPQASAKVNFCIQDAMITLQSFYQTGDKSVTGNDILKFMLRDITNYLDFTQCILYVFAFDKPSYVFKAKGIEHKKRALKRKIDPAPDPEEGENLLPLDSSIPYNWGSMMANRKTRRALIHQITMAIVENFHPPAGKMLVIDGGLLNEESQPLLIYSHPAEPGKQVLNSTKSILLSDCAIQDKENSLTKKEIKRPEHLRNEAGEADICYLFYLNYFWEAQLAHRTKENILASDDPIYIDVRSHDTDFIPISLSYFNTVAEGNFHVRVFFNGSKKDEENRNVLLVNKLYWETRYYLSHILKRPELCMIAAMMSSGNDYVDGYVGLVPARTLKIFLTESDYIGDLVLQQQDGNWVLDSKAYVRLLKALYCDKYKTAISKEIPGAKGKKKKDFSDFWKETLTWTELRDLVKKRNKKNNRAHIPDPKVIWLRFLRLQFNLEILRIGYKVSPGQIDQQCLDLGFTLIHKDQPIAYHNIRITEDQDEDCKPEKEFLDYIN